MQVQEGTGGDTKQRKHLRLPEPETPSRTGGVDPDVKKRIEERKLRRIGNEFTFQFTGGLYLWPFSFSFSIACFEALKRNPPLPPTPAISNPISATPSRTSVMTPANPARPRSTSEPPTPSRTTSTPVTPSVTTAPPTPAEFRTPSRLDWEGKTPVRGSQWDTPLVGPREGAHAPTTPSKAPSGTAGAPTAAPATPSRPREADSEGPGREARAMAPPAPGRRRPPPRGSPPGGAGGKLPIEETPGPGQLWRMVCHVSFIQSVGQTGWDASKHSKDTRSITHSVWLGAPWLKSPRVCVGASHELQIVAVLGQAGRVCEVERVASAVNHQRRGTRPTELRASLAERGPLTPCIGPAIGAQTLRISRRRRDHPPVKKKSHYRQSGRITNNLWATALEIGH